MTFRTIDELRMACLVLPEGNDTSATAAAARQSILTKPLGSLGRLEEIAIWLARWQGRALPRLDRVHVLVFAGSHGVTAQGVSAFPAEVTAQMVQNFARGGAAINQLARQTGAKLVVKPLDIEKPTADFTQAPAMTADELLEAVNAGINSVPDDADLICLGEMGIGNTTAAAALAAALFGGTARDWVGRGTGVDDAGFSRKVEVVDRALAHHAKALADPLEALRRVGGRELAAMFGAALAARKRRIPLMLDGFVCTAAAAVLARLAQGGLAHAMTGHVSAEAGHRKLVDCLGQRPLLDLGMRLGEASGACLAVDILRGAIACHSGMATFTEAGIAEG